MRVYLPSPCRVCSSLLDVDRFALAALAGTNPFRVRGAKKGKDFVARARELERLRGPATSKPIERTRPSKKINSLFSVLRQRLALSQACLLHAHILPAMTSACCLKATTSTPICRSPCRRYQCGSLAGHN